MQLTQILRLAGVAAAAALPEGQQKVLTEEGLPDMPALGFGTWNLAKANASAAVEHAIQTGFRHIDAAAIYGNEAQTGAGIAAGLAATSLPRSALWVTSKLWNTAHAPAAVAPALDATLADLRLDHVDLYLMHWPVATSTAGGSSHIDFLETWDAMVALLATGKARHVGVSNFSPAQLDALTRRSAVKPFAHQFETHPYLPQAAFVAAHEQYGIRVTAYSPLGNMNPTYGSARKAAAGTTLPPLLANPVVKKIAKARGCTPAQVALAWGLGRGTAVIPKAARAEHIDEDYGAPDCRLADADWKELAKLPVRRFNNPGRNWGVTLFEGLEDAAAKARLGEAGRKVLDALSEGFGLFKLVAGKVVERVRDL